jgi:hypothetical protein
MLAATALVSGGMNCVTPMMVSGLFISKELTHPTHKTADG